MPAFLPRIAIVGGGPSGLALGALLRQRGMQATIYELRAKPSATQLARPSGMLDLHEESGLRVVRECNLWDKFQAALGDCSESSRVLTPAGQVLHTDEGSEQALRPEIARNALTSLFSNKVPEAVIKWQHKISRVRSGRSERTGAVEITLDLATAKSAADSNSTKNITNSNTTKNSPSDGSSASSSPTYDLVIGADGAWSKVRALLSQTHPSYSGAQLLTATVRHVSTRYPHLAALCGTGSLGALGGGKAILTHRGPQDSICVYAMVKTPDENWATTLGLQNKTAAEVGKVLLEEDEFFGKWAAELKELLRVACVEDTDSNMEESSSTNSNNASNNSSPLSGGFAADIKPLYALPPGQRWPHHPATTLVGDAAHLMTPWAGEGVNLALWDALDLADLLSAMPETHSAAKWQAALDPLLEKFEESITARAREKALEAVQNQEMFLSENGAEQMAEFFKRGWEKLASRAAELKGV